MFSILVNVTPLYGVVILSLSNPSSLIIAALKPIPCIMSNLEENKL